MLGGRPLGSSTLGGEGGEAFLPALIDSASLGQVMDQKGTWCHTYDVIVDSTITLRYTDNQEPITAFGYTYPPYPIKMGAVGDTAKSENKTFKITVANIDRTLIAYLENGKLIGLNITVSTVFLPFDGSPVLYRSQDTYDILGASLDSTQAFIVFEVGKYNFFKAKIPSNRWNDTRCGWVYKNPDTCGYGRDEFDDLTKIDLKLGGDGAKIYGWNALNIEDAGITAADIDITRSSYLTFTYSNTYNPSWTGATTTSPYLYRTLPVGDYSFEMEGHGKNATQYEHIGTVLRRVANPAYWYRFTIGTTTIKIVRNSDGSDEVVFTLTTSDAFDWLKVTKVDGKHSFYVKFADEISYRLLYEETRTAWSNGSNSNGYEVGPMSYADNPGTRSEVFSAEFDAFNLISGGYATCNRTLVDCRQRDNALRFGGSPGVQHNTIRL